MYRGIIIDNLFSTLENVFLVVVDLWVERGVRILPVSVEVMSGQVAAIVAMNDTIGVQHRYYLPHEHAAQPMGFGLIGQQKINHAFQYEGGNCLAGVHSRTEENCWFPTKGLF